MRNPFLEISKHTLIGGAIRQIARQMGAPSQAVLDITGAATSGETFTVNGWTYELLTATTAAGTATGGQFNNTTNPLVGVTLTAHGAVVGDYIKMENEFMEVIKVVDANTVNLARGALGTAPAAHVDTTAAFLNDSAPTAGEVHVGLTDGATAATIAADIIASFNAGGDAGVGGGIRAGAAPGTRVAFTWDGGLAFPTTEAMANGAFLNGAAALAGVGEGNTLMAAYTRTVAGGNFVFMFDFPVQNAEILVLGKAYDGGLTIDGNGVEPNNSGAVDVANADVVTIIAYG